MEETPEQKSARLVFEQSMKDALAHLDAVREEVLLDKEKAIDEQIAARDLRSQIERDAERISEAYMEEHRKQHMEELRKKIWGEVLRKLILSGLPSMKLKQTLELTPEMLTDVWMEIGFDKMGENHIGHVGYQSDGRSGHVILYREDVVLQFYYEFGGADLLAYIMVPTAEHWVSQTGIPLEERKMVLEFIAKRVVRDQAPGHHYRMTQDAIYIE